MNLIIRLFFRTGYHSMQAHLQISPSLSYSSSWLIISSACLSLSKHTCCSCFKVFVLRCLVVILIDVSGNPCCYFLVGYFLILPIIMTVGSVFLFTSSSSLKFFLQYIPLWRKEEFIFCWSDKCRAAFIVQADDVFLKTYFPLSNHVQDCC